MDELIKTNSQTYKLLIANSTKLGNKFRFSNVTRFAIPLNHLGVCSLKVEP